MLSLITDPAGPFGSLAVILLHYLIACHASALLAFP